MQRLNFLFYYNIRYIYYTETVIYMTQSISKFCAGEDFRSCFKSVLIAIATYFICTRRVHIYAGNGTAVSLQILNPATGKSGHRKRMRNRELPVVNDCCMIINRSSPKFLHLIFLVFDI